MVPPTSPSSSQQAYSPPPPAEVQIAGRQSDPVLGEPGPIIIDSEDPARLDQGATRRIRPGTKAADMASGPPLVPLNQVGQFTVIVDVTPPGIKRLITTQLDSAFQNHEHLIALHYAHTHPTDTTTVPLTHETALLIATPPDNVDRSLWLYELTRFLTQHANDLLVALLTKIDPACSAASCPEMRASEWQYLCAVHDTPKACCAVDYCIHTLDWAGDILTNVKLFPSRMTLGPPESPSHQAAVRNITNIMRRVYRIFAHAWFQHREGVFWPVEGSGGIYTLFKTVCDVYGLIQEDNYTIPPEAEGLPSNEEMEHDRQEKAGTKKTDEEEEGEEDAATLQMAGATTRRHKNTPSVGSAVGTIAEGEEDESESPVKEKGGPLAHISNAAEKKDDVPEPAGSASAGEDGTKDEDTAGVEKEGEDSGDTAEDNADDTASVVTAIHDDTEEAEKKG